MSICARDRSPHPSFGRLPPLRDCLFCASVRLHCWMLHHKSQRMPCRPHRRRARLLILRRYTFLLLLPCCSPWPGTGSWGGRGGNGDPQKASFRAGDPRKAARAPRTAGDPERTPMWTGIQRRPQKNGDPGKVSGGSRADLPPPILGPATSSQNAS